MNAGRNVSPCRSLPGLLVLTGILLGLLLSTLAAWADYESTSYGFMRRAHTPLRGLSCPVFMGKNESRAISVKVSNPTEQTLFPGVSTQISTAQNFDSQVEHIELQPGQEFTLHRTVGPENIDLGFFIFAGAQVFATYPLPDRETTCGILVLPVNGHGALVLIAGTALSILCMAAGIWLLYQNRSPLRHSNSIWFMVVATVLAMTSSFLGWWLQAVVVIVVLVLTLLLTAGTFLEPA